MEGRADVGGGATVARSAVSRLFAAIEARDVVAIESVLHPDASWQNVPHPAALGREAVLGLLAPIVRWSDEIHWEIRSASFEPGIAWVERSDRFVISHAEHAVACHGVFGVDSDGLVTFVRDYADLAEWRQRIAPVYSAMRSRPAVDVVARHLSAVERRDCLAMSLDYALDAHFIRDGQQYTGYREIARYFADVPNRLGDRRLVLSPPQPIGEHDVQVRWSIDVATGVDRYVVSDGWIQHQVVTLDGRDF
jgi:limonene-1,2-epoxide hydrolase